MKELLRKIILYGILVILTLVGILGLFVGNWWNKLMSIFILYTVFDILKDTYISFRENK